MLLKVVIVDDEFPARNYLSSLLTLIFPGKITVVEQCDSVKSAVVAIQQYNPDIVFLDIQMPGEGGLELFNYFTTIDFKVVFTTAYKDFALNAFKVNALDYLLKPLTVSDVRDSVERYMNNSNSNFTLSQKKLLIENSNTITPEEKMIISTKRGFEVLNLKDIIYCKAEESYTHFFTIQGTILASKSFGDSCKNLLEPTFIRIHKSYTVNINYIKSFHTSDFSLELLNGETIPVSDKSFTKKRLMDAISR